MPLGVPVDPLEYSQKHASSLQVGSTASFGSPPATRPAAHQRLERRQQRLGDEERLRARVAQHEFEVLGREQRVGRHRHHAREDAAQEHDRPLERVEHGDHHARFGRIALGAQRIGELLRLRRELAVGQGGAARRIDVRHLRRPGGIALEQVVCGVVVARDLDPGRGGGVIGVAQMHARCLFFVGWDPRSGPQRAHGSWAALRAAQPALQAAVFCMAGRASASHSRHHCVPSSSGKVPALASCTQTSPMRCAPSPCRRSSNFLPPNAKVCT